MSAALLSLPLGDAMRLHPSVGAFFDSVDGGAAKPDKILGRWIAELGDDALEKVGMGREQIANFLQSLIEGVETARAASSALAELRVLGGRDKRGREEQLDLILRPGDIACVVGPTGSGKSRLLGDIECLAQGDTPSGRRVLVNAAAPDPARRWAASGKLVAQLSQNMNFVVDLTVGDFIAMHADCRGVADWVGAARDVIECANRLAGEKFMETTSLTQLSGGQSRALMIADVALLSASPIVLIDEIENAGIDRKQALDLLVASDKVVLLSTHDPILALLGDRRVVVSGGAVVDVVETSVRERAQLAVLERYDRMMMDVRERLRRGGRIDHLPHEMTAPTPDRTSLRPA